MNQICHLQRTIYFRDGDPAQIMFFGHLFGFAHDAFEQFLLQAGLTWQAWFRSTEHIVPIRHTEADYKAPFFPGETYDIQVTVAHMGESSFKMKYVFGKGSQTHATVTMVHTFLDARTKQKISIPDFVRNCLSPYLEKGASK